ncbi:hypothetical protein [Sedimenticola sp.]
MLIFWGSAVGGIVLAINWARLKGRNPVKRELLEKSLKQRLERGDLSREAYDQKLAALKDSD